MYVEKNNNNILALRLALITIYRPKRVDKTCYYSTVNTLTNIDLLQSNVTEENNRRTIRRPPNELLICFNI